MTNLITDLVFRDEESPLQTAVDEHEEIDLEIQSTVADEGTIAPCAWVHGPPTSIDAVSSSFESEPTIASHRRLSGGEGSDQRLYRIEWTDSEPSRPTGRARRQRPLGGA